MKQILIELQAKAMKTIEYVSESLETILPKFKYAGDIAQNLLLYIKNPLVWLSFSTLGVFFEKYIFSEWSIGISFFFVMLIDTFVGSFVAYKQKNFSFKTFREKFMDKAVVYSTLIFAFSISSKMTFEDGSRVPIDYLNIPFYSLLATAEIGSIVRNLYNYKKWPVLKKLISHFPEDNQEDERKL